jgi:ATP-dependent DNA helicase RecG
MPVTRLSGVGPKQAEKLSRLKIKTVQDCLFHLPLRYQDRTRLVAIGDLRVGIEAVCIGQIQSTDVLYRGRRSMVCHIADSTGELRLRFFHFNQSQTAALKEGQRIRCFGEIRRASNCLEIVHPEYQLLGATELPEVEERLTPVYPITEGLHQLSMRRIADRSIALLREYAIDELLPNADTQCSLQEALMTVHQPGPEVSAQALLEGTHPAVQRLALEELVAHRLSVQRGRVVFRQFAAPAIERNGDLLQRLLDDLPFSPTTAQQRVIAEIAEDLADPRPMLRLIQGDVGSGKTLVAAAAAAMVVDCGYQVSIMAPTEILAEQHLLNFARWFEPLGVRIAWLKGKLGARQRRETLESIASGDSAIVVGTHALFQKDVAFARLGLTIVDEQHRFGVDQRLLLREKGVRGEAVPHQLTMTATPIPRTLSMTAYADLDCSIIDELPPGRQPITTVAISTNRRAEVIERVGAVVASGKQVYWVCTLIEESEVLQARAAEEALEELRTWLPEVSIGLVHGRMSAEEKDAAMQQFKRQEVSLLVATTVIEVGVDVPNASLIIIENAERLGLSQLHQLRGRVGRGDVASHCVLLFEAGLSRKARERIAIMRETTDGFAIAEKDLQLRGAGELLGTRQTGSLQFRIADIMRDKSLLEQASEISDSLINRSDAAVDALIDRWLGGDAPEYGNV